MTACFVEGDMARVDFLGNRLPFALPLAFGFVFFFESFSASSSPSSFLATSFGSFTMAKPSVANFMTAPSCTSPSQNRKQLNEQTKQNLRCHVWENYFPLKVFDHIISRRLAPQTNKLCGA
jgi:hypothetical protein